MIRTFIYRPGKQPEKYSGSDQIVGALDDPENLVWVSLEQASDQEIIQILNLNFHFHPLAVEDCLSTGYQTPKIDDFGEYLFLIVHAIRPDGSFEALETMELNSFVGPNYLVTCYRDETMPPVEATWAKITRDERMYTNGADFLYHAVLDELVDEYMPVIDHMDDEIDWLEERVMEKPEPTIIERIIALKHAVMAMRRILNPQREVINQLSRDDFPQIDPRARIYFRNVYDHLVRIQDMTDIIRDILTGAMDIYLNSTSMRMNEIMKALTIVSTIFLPLSFIAGVYGMNFHFMPELSQPWGYPAIWVVFILIAGGMLYLFKRRGWF